MIDREVHLFKCDGPGCNAYATVSLSDLSIRSARTWPPEVVAPDGWHVLILAGTPDKPDGDRTRVACSDACLDDYVEEFCERNAARTAPS